METAARIARLPPLSENALGDENVLWDVLCALALVNAFHVRAAPPSLGMLSSPVLSARAYIEVWKNGPKTISHDNTLQWKIARYRLCPQAFA